MIGNNTVKLNKIYMDPCGGYDEDAELKESEMQRN
jgi:hypothetical protein